MKKSILVLTALSMFTLVAILQPTKVNAQDNSKTTMLAESKDAKSAFSKADKEMENLFKNSYGYVIFPNIGKGALGVGGAGGNGTVYEKGIAVGKAKMVQVTVGLQAGGEAYREVIFFENKAAFDRFKENKLEFSGQVSAVAAKEGASANAKYRDGVLVFTQERGGLMLEASVGGQKFSYTAF